MKEEKATSQDSLKKWIVEAGMDSPGEDFHLAVLKKIESLPQAAPAYRPVIAPWAWVLILGLVSLIVAGSFLTSASPSSPEADLLAESLQRLKQTLPNFGGVGLTLPSLHLSPPFLIGVLAFFILGFIAIAGPLKRRQEAI